MNSNYLPIKKIVITSKIVSCIVLENIVDKSEDIPHIVVYLSGSQCANQREQLLVEVHHSILNNCVYHRQHNLLQLNQNLKTESTINREKLTVKP